MPAQPLFETTRGQIVESVHFGSIAVVDSNGKMIASYGDPQMVAFLRSSAKPFQVLPFVERGGMEYFGFTPRELALSCASHEGSDVDELKTLIVHDQNPTTNHNNCSGKHTAMLAHAKMRRLPLETYLEHDHP